MFTKPNFLVTTILLITSLLLSQATWAEEADTKAAINAYQLQPGDVLQVTVWKEKDLSDDDVIVRPDGMITFPLIGEIVAAGNSVDKLRGLIAKRLTKYIPDPVVTVSVRQLSGNTVYVIGKVNRPGEFQTPHYVDVIQALTMAGGTSTYAALNKIKILRRENGILRAIPFRYGDIEKGKKLEQNIILKAGDVVLVP